MKTLWYFFIYIKSYITSVYYSCTLELNMAPRIQQKRLLQTLKYASNHVPFYKNRKYSVGGNLNDFPIINKIIIREQGSRMYSDKISDSWTHWQNTGGSTGQPLRFPTASLNLLNSGNETAHQFYLYRKMGYRFGDHICSVDGRRVDDKDLAKGIYWGYNRNTFPYGKEHFSTLYLNDSTALSYINKLNKVKPAFLRGYPSGIKSLCEYIVSSRVELSFRLKGVYLTSENFDESQRKYISSVFQCPVWGQYGHSEMSIFGYQRPNDKKYYISPFYGYTEILDENGNQVKEGEIGEIVVTGFNNYGLLFIRYMTGDLAEYGGTLKNGEVVLNSLLGRAADYIVDKNNRKQYLVGLIFGGHLHAFSEIRHWQIEQHEIGEVIIRIVKDSNWKSQTENEIIQFFMNNGFSPKIEYVDCIEKTARGKQKFLIQTL